LLQLVQKTSKYSTLFIVERWRGVFHLALNNYQSHETKIEKEFSRYIYNILGFCTPHFILSSSLHTLNEVYPQ